MYIKDRPEFDLVNAIERIDEVLRVAVQLLDRTEKRLDTVASAMVGIEKSLFSLRGIEAHLEKIVELQSERGV